MPVTLPTATDVRKAREQAARNAADRAEVARTPLLAVLGAGDYAYTTVTKVVTDARSRATERAEEVQSFVQTLPQRLTTDELRKAVADLREQAEERYEGFAERGEKAWGRIRTRPQVKQAISTIEAYTEQLDARVDTFVDDAHDAAEKALATVTRQTRSTGEKVALAAEEVAADAAATVSKVSREVAEAGNEVSSEIAGAGEDVAHETRSVSRRAANRTAPKTATRKPAARRTNGTTTK